jgi:hypothetical protein
MTLRPDETWHRLRDWTYGSALSERLAGQVLLDQGYEDFDPIHPLGGPDGGKDALCRKHGKRWVMAVYFPRGQQGFNAIKIKFTHDLAGVGKNNVDGIVFVTNQELTDGARTMLKGLGGLSEVEIFHLERVVAVLDQPRMGAVREQFLFIDGDQESAAVAETIEVNAPKKLAWVWHCSDESIAAGQISLLAVGEIFLAVGLYWWLSIHFDWPWTAFVGMVAAPMLLLRSNESIEVGLGNLKYYWQHNDINLDLNP